MNTVPQTSARGIALLFIRHREQPRNFLINRQKDHFTAHAKVISTQCLRLTRSIFLFFLTLLCCSPAPAETLIIPGSGNPEYILGVLAKAFNEQQSLHRVVIPPTIGSAGAFREISEGNASIGRIGRPLIEKERQQGLSYHSLGRDPIVFVGGSGVTARNINRAQVIAIYSGQISNWQELGGKPATIRAIGRESTNGPSLSIASKIEGFNSIKYSDSVKFAHLDSQLLELLDRFPASFGFLNRSALSAAKTRLTLLSLDGTEASAENLISGRYPLSVEIGLIYKKNKLTEAGHSFLRFISSPRGLDILHAHGLVSSVEK